MKDKSYTEIVCKKFCKYYKEGKEELLCGGYEFLRNNLTPHELKIMLNSPLPPLNLRGGEGELYLDEELISLVCKQCGFFIDGCDFAESRSGPPCGGYILISRIVSRRAC
ncbi:MAG: hypothetical protein A2077_01520 [Nitrospirae bacterium GWC2_46_6]|nr:MAG: hypothetical protein A2077_01520 [Nitrospirae bacterium GWC2_46_6]OGW22609.1 MAG: hypothetical protein A2Z82_08910 [Nitrospirae bacterium GWA2_46_11]OGW24003.1 MAG: hypothetical protein A2X55_09925 [Nitrospirae bacterium GWB2_47_37]HAK88846.1 hypothetical protein [Nitrospiraceae bacterium]